MSAKSINIENNSEKSSDITFYSLSVEEFFECERYVISPEYIRKKYTWNIEKAGLFIESVLLNWPAASVMTSIEGSKEYIIDGYQRICSIYNFINDSLKLENLKILSHLNGFKYSDLPAEYKKQIKSYDLYIICNHNLKQESILNYYKRLNFGSGDKLDNGINYYENTDLKNLIEEMMSYKAFRQVFEGVEKGEQAEFLIRFLALQENFDSYNGNMKDFIKSYIIQSKNFLTSDKRRNLLLDFKNTLDSCIQIFQEDVFRNCIHLQTSKGVKNVMYKSLSKPVFEMQMLGVAGVKFSQIYRNRFFLKQKYEEALLLDDNFKPYYKKMSKRALEYRVNVWRNIIRDVVE